MKDGIISLVLFVLLMAIFFGILILLNYLAANF